MSLISIVVPTYRRPHFLVTALRSVQRQTFADFEVLVCDNAAQDETARVVKDLGDDRFQYVPRERNLGMVASAYAGLRAARGEFLVKLDDDDELNADFLKVLVAPLLADPALTVSAGGLTLVDSDGAPLEERTAQEDADTGRDRLPEGVIRPFTPALTRGTFDLCSAMIRSSALDWNSIDERAGTAYDIHLLLEAARDGAGAHYTRRRLMSYRQHAGSDTVTATVAQTEGALFVWEHALASGAHVNQENLEVLIRYTGVELARLLIREGRGGEARAVLRRTGVLGAAREVGQLWALAGLPAPLAGRIARGRAAAADSAGR